VTDLEGGGHRRANEGHSNRCDRKKPEMVCSSHSCNRYEAGGSGGSFREGDRVDCQRSKSGHPTVRSTCAKKRVNDVSKSIWLSSIYGRYWFRSSRIRERANLTAPLTVFVRPAGSTLTAPFSRPACNSD